MGELPVKYDGIYYAESDDMYRRWDGFFAQGKMSDLEQFVTKHVSGRGPARFVPGGIYEGSYNRVVRFSFASGGSDVDVALKFPMPGRTDGSLSREKITNEAAWIQFFKEKTTIPVPDIYSCTTQTNDLLSPLGLPYILMDWVPGENLRDFLAKGQISEKLRSSIFQQIASIYLQLHHLTFTGIGSIAKDDATGEWGVTERPLTIDMHQFAIGIPEFPKDHWPNMPLGSSSDYLMFVVSQHDVQLRYLRNLNLEEKTEDPQSVPSNSNSDSQVTDRACRRYIARYGFSQLIRQFYSDEDNLGPFHPFCADLDSRNMLVDPETGIITGLIDVEYTNAMPAQFARDPPLWLFKILPEQCLDRGFFPWFLQQYTPLFHEFLEAMRRVENEGAKTLSGETPLSSQMLESWTSGRVWFNYAATHSDHVDSLYWQVLYKHHPEKAVLELPPDLKVDLEKYLRHTKDQIKRYEDEWTERYRKAIR